jgi:Uma2 family endonuclease
MSTALDLLTNEQLEQLPDEGMERELIQGELRERPMTRRNRFHATVESRIVKTLGLWLDSQDELAAEVMSGEVGCILEHDPDTTVGIDVAVFPMEVVHHQTELSSQVDGIPLLAVEILSPSDTHEASNEKVLTYLRTGVPVVWNVDPDFQTVCVYRPEREPQLFSRSQTLAQIEELPGLQVPLRELFPKWMAR